MCTTSTPHTVRLPTLGIAGERAYLSAQDRARGNQVPRARSYGQGNTMRQVPAERLGNMARYRLTAVSIQAQECMVCGESLSSRHHNPIPLGPCGRGPRKSASRIGKRRGVTRIPVPKAITVDRRDPSPSHALPPILITMAAPTNERNNTRGGTERR